MPVFPFHRVCVPRALFAVVLSCVLAALTAWPGSAHAVSSRACLFGSDPGVANDLYQITALRQLIETSACPAAYFDGTVPALAHNAYFTCIANEIQNAVITNNLRRQCKNAVRKLYKVSTPGQPVTFSGKIPVPCVSKTANGNVRCRLSTECANGVSCPDFFTCVDAADTNHNGAIDRGDSGTCNPPPVCGNTVREASEQCDPNGTTCPAGQGCLDCRCIPCLACPASDTCHVGGACDGAFCSPPRPDGSPCDGGSDCAAGSCQSGICTVPPTAGATQTCTCPNTPEGGLQTCNADGETLDTCVPQTGGCFPNDGQVFGNGKGGISTFRHAAGSTLNHPRIHVVLWNDDPIFQTDPTLLAAWQDFPSVLASSRLYRAILNNYVIGYDPGDAYAPIVGTLGAVADGDRNIETITLVDVDRRLDHVIDNGLVPGPGDTYDEFYLVLLPPYKQIACTCGAQHSSYAKGAFPTREVYFGIIETGVDDTDQIRSLESITYAMSHEYVEAVTDPICDTWYGGECFTDEVVDKCEDQTAFWRESTMCGGRNWLLAQIEHGGSCAQPVLEGRACSPSGTDCAAFEVGDFHNQNFGSAPWPVDWFPGSYKAECAPGMALRGMSAYASGFVAGLEHYANRMWHGLITEHDFAHGILCANQGGNAIVDFPRTACTVRNVSTGDDRATTVTGDWDPGNWKGECAEDEYVSGVSQTPDGRVTGLLCCQSPTVGHDACATLRFNEGNASEATSYVCDWDRHFYKSQCGSGRYVAGVSVDPNHNGGPIAVLCCE